jgi:hypothetical protein
MIMIRIEDEDDTYVALIKELGPAPISRIFRQRLIYGLPLKYFIKNYVFYFEMDSSVLFKRNNNDHCVDSYNRIFVRCDNLIYLIISHIYISIFNYISDI